MPAAHDLVHVTQLGLVSSQGVVMARGGNKKQKQGKQQKQTALQHRPDPSVACFALHPGSKFVAIAINDVVRVIRLRWA